MIKNMYIKQCDITQEKSDAIVNAANTSLLGGGGVDGAIHRAAGPKLLEECRKINGCQSGEARITKGYNLFAKYIIHTPGPIYKDGKSNESQLLYNSYYNSLLLAKEYKCTSISFPAISTGVYNYPKEEACKIAIDTTIEFMLKESYQLEVYFILFDTINYNIYNNYLKSL